jgi:hypothetical protein
MTLEEKIEELKLLERLFLQYCVPALAANVQERVSSLIRQPLSPETVYKAEWEKGVCVGLEIASALPQTLREEAEAELVALEKEQNDVQI